MLPTTTASSNTLLLFLPSLPYLPTSLSLFPAQMFVRSTPHARFRSRQHVKARERRAGAVRQPLYAIPYHSFLYILTPSRCRCCPFSLHRNNVFPPTPPFSSFLFVLSTHTAHHHSYSLLCSPSHVYTICRRLPPPSLVFLRQPTLPPVSTTNTYTPRKENRKKTPSTARDRQIKTKSVYMYVCVCVYALL